MKAIRFLAWLSLSMVLSACAVVTTAGDIAQGRQAMLEGNYQLALDYFWTGDQIDRQLHLRRRATGGSLELFGQSSIPDRELCASASDFRKRPFPSPERQCRTAIPGPYVGSSRRAATHCRRRGREIEQEEDDFRVSLRS